MWTTWRTRTTASWSRTSPPKACRTRCARRRAPDGWPGSTSSKRSSGTIEVSGPDADTLIEQHIAGIPGEEATVKRYHYDPKSKQIVLIPANERLTEMRFAPAEVTIFGRVVTVMRRV